MSPGIGSRTRSGSRGHIIAVWSYSQILPALGFLVHQMAIMLTSQASWRPWWEIASWNHTVNPTVLNKHNQLCPNLPDPNCVVLFEWAIFMAPQILSLLFSITQQDHLPRVFTQQWEHVRGGEAMQPGWKCFQPPRECEILWVHAFQWTSTPDFLPNVHELLEAMVCYVEGVVLNLLFH